MMKANIYGLCIVSLLAASPCVSRGQDTPRATSQSMDKIWGDRVVKLRAENAARGQLFDEGNYAMFIHWGLYSQLGNKVDGKTYYGIGEWIMNPRMAGIPVPEYKKLAATFNPVNFDAKEIARIAKARRHEVHRDHGQAPRWLRDVSLQGVRVQHC